MPLTFRAGAGKVAIYDSSAGDLPFDNPLADIARVKFHSDLDYIQIIATLQGQVTLPQRSATASGSYYTTFVNGPAHGRPGIPLVFGYVNVNGTNVAFAGSVPFVSSNNTWKRFVSLGASPTNIVFNIVGSAPPNTLTPALTLTYTVFVSDEILS